LAIVSVFAPWDIKVHIVSFRFHVLLDQADKPVSTEPSPASSETAVAHAHTDGKELTVTNQYLAQSVQMAVNVKIRELP